MIDFTILAIIMFAYKAGYPGQNRERQRTTETRLMNIKLQTQNMMMPMATAMG
jgi:hypothetical protein